MLLFVGSTYADSTIHFSGNKSNVSLTPKHSLKGDLLYALPGKWRIGVDYELKSSQTLSNGNQKSSFWTYGAVVEYLDEKIPQNVQFRYSIFEAGLWTN